MSSERLARVLAGDHGSAVAELSLAEVRAQRKEAQEVELGLSYARRLVQGRLDIIHAEAERRRTGEGPSDLRGLVEQLKAGKILGDSVRPPGFGRLTVLMAPDEAGDEFAAEIDEVANVDCLANLPELADDVLSSLIVRLVAVERSLSDRRRQVFGCIDALQAEIVRRYQVGLADPDELLR